MEDLRNVAPRLHRGLDVGLGERRRGQRKRGGDKRELRGAHASPSRQGYWHEVARGVETKERAFSFDGMLAKVALLGWGERVSRQLITEYRSELDRIHAASGSKRESVVRDFTSEGLVE